jgi:hypothetical protein
MSFFEVMLIKFEDNVFQLAGVFTKPNKKVVHHTLCSFRKSLPVGKAGTKGDYDE